MAKNGLNRDWKKGSGMLLLAAFAVAWTGAGKSQAQPNAPATDPQAVVAAPEAQKPPATKPAAKKSAAKKPAAKKAAPTAATSVKKVVGRRDPFRIPGPPVPGRVPGEEILGPLPPGIRGLVISQLRLEGIVRLDVPNTMIAVVDTNANRAYFLRENDAVYNGVVSKITPDSVYFRENAIDPSGNVVTREVVKRLSAGPGEGR